MIHKFFFKYSDMTDIKISKDEYLKRREESRKEELIVDRLRRHPWMTRQQVEEQLHIETLSEGERVTYLKNRMKSQLKEKLLTHGQVSEELAQQLSDGGVVYFHKIASSLPFEQFHAIAHIMIGSVAAGC